MSARRLAATVGLALWAALAPEGRADAPKLPKPPAAVVDALADYLTAPAVTEEKALDRLLLLVGDDLATGVAAIRAQKPLSDAKPGVVHGVTFESGGRRWEYSLRIPRGYDGKKRLPVLVLPDHGSVDEKAGIDFWEGWKGVEEYVLFRPVIAKNKEDRERFPDQQFFAVDQAMARVMGDALTHLRLHYAVDPDRFVMTGLSQAGFYTWYYAVTFPDQFAGIVPESSGGVAVRAAVLSLARNLAAVSVRILHTKGDKICPFADAEAMRDALKSAKGKVELIAYTEKDYMGAIPPQRHPGPHDKRVENVLPWGVTVRREIPKSFTRVIRYATQGFEGRFRIPPPAVVTSPFTVTCGEAPDGTLSCDRPGVAYLADPMDLLAGKTFRSGGKSLPAKPDLRLLFSTFKATGDDGRLVGASIALP